MTLIEVLLHYRELLLQEGCVEADTFLRNAVDPHLRDHIRSSVNDDGEFIDGFGKAFVVIDKR